MANQSQIVEIRGGELTPEYWLNQIDLDPRLKSPHTRRNYKGDLADFLDFAGGRPVTKNLVEAYLVGLQTAGKAPASINRKLAAVRWLVRRVADLAGDNSPQNPEEQMAQLGILRQADRIAGMKGIKGSRELKGRHISPGELSALIGACEGDQTPAGFRDVAIISIGAYAGLRRAEIAGLTFEDWQPGDDGGDFIIHGKGDKTRPAYISNGAFAALQDWLVIRGTGPGPLFYHILKSGKLTPGGLGCEALQRILDKRKGQAKIKPLTFHDLRRTFAGEMFSAGHDTATVQKLMGHASSDQTTKYDRRGDEVRRKAVKSLHIPYQRRLG